MDNIVYIIIHHGIGDLFNSIGLINYYSTKYNVYLLLEGTQYTVMKEIYKNNNKIVPILPKFINYDELKDLETCFNCMSLGKQGNNCREGKKCKFIDYNSLNGTIIKIGSFNNSINWESFRKKEYSFAHAFYTYNNLNTQIRFDFFELFNDKIQEELKYNIFIKKYGEEYILIHEDDTRGLRINKNYIKNKYLPIINLDKISDNFVDFFKIIENAKEIHLIDSSWSVFIYMLSYKNINIQIFLNETLAISNGRDTNIYKNPTFNNWNFY